MSPANKKSATTIAKANGLSTASGDVPPWAAQIRKEIMTALRQAADPSEVRALVNEVCDEAAQEKNLVDLIALTPQIAGYPTTMTPEMESHLNEIAVLAKGNPVGASAFDPLMALVAEGDNPLFVMLMRILMMAPDQFRLDWDYLFTTALKTRVETTDYPFTKDVWDILGKLILWTSEPSEMMLWEPSFLRGIAEKTPPEAFEVMFKAVTVLDSNFDGVVPVGADLKTIPDGDERWNEDLETSAYNVFILGLLVALMRAISAGGETAHCALEYIMNIDTSLFFPMEALFSTGVIDAIGVFDRASTDDRSKALVKRVRDHIAVLLEQKWFG
jgi:hypothetical protein